MNQIVEESILTVALFGGKFSRLVMCDDKSQMQGRSATAEDEYGQE